MVRAFTPEVCVVIGARMFTPDVCELSLVQGLLL